MDKSLQDNSAHKNSIVVISDTHLGMKNRTGGRLDQFLKNLDTETLVLNGDIIDGLRISGCSKKRLTADDLNIMDALNEQIAKGTKVVYIPGNHDEALRKMDLYGKTILGITFAEYYVHKTPEGKSFFISHGDQFDEPLQHTTNVSSRLFKIGDFFYDSAAQADKLINKITQATLKKQFDFYGFVRNDAYRTIIQLTKVFNAESSDEKLTLKQALRNLKHVTKNLKIPSAAEQNFRDAAMARARRAGYAGVVCGHTHEPELSKSRDGIIYANSGDWIRHFSALAMDKRGEWDILRQKDEEPQKFKKRKSGKADKDSHSGATLEMVDAIDDIWPRKKFSSIYSGYEGA